MRYFKQEKGREKKLVLIILGLDLAALKFNGLVTIDL